MSENTNATPATQSEQSSASNATPASLAGITRKPASKPAQRTSARKPAGSKPAQRTSKPAQNKPAGKTVQSERTVSQRKVSVMNAMIHASAALVSSDAAFASAQRKYSDLRDVSRSEARAMLSARLSYAPGDEWDAALDAPTVLQAGKRSKIARVAAQTRVTRSAQRAASKSAKPAGKPAQRKPAQSRKSA